ncbi:MAG TPA: hypothetical protein PKK69_05585 [Ferruginibacter sp.]|nr:hypothetical protein [Ferruginibacter sp.]
MHKMRLFQWLLVWGLFSGCGVGHKSLKKPYDWIPTDFDYAQKTLLIEKHPYSKTMNRKLIRFFHKRYKWDFIVTTRDSIQKKMGEFSNTKKYPYALLWTCREKNNPRSNDPAAPGSIADYYFMYANFYNRQKDSAYRNAPNTAAFSVQTFRVIANTLKKRWK